MLQELRVSNFAIIENVQLAFRPGLNILSGETGAGKSILLKSLGLLMGDKADASAVRSGAEQAVIEGSFDLEARPDIKLKLDAMGIDCPDSTMVVRRIVAVGAKARVYINGALSTLTALRDVVSPLVEVAGQTVPLIELTGQHDNRHLLSKSYHLEILDQYAGTTTLRLEFSSLFARRKEVDSEIHQIRTEERNRALRLDFLAFSRDEIRGLDLSPGDEVVIETEAKRLKHAKRLMEFASSTQEILDGDEDSVASRLHALVMKAQDLKQLDQTLAEKLAPLDQARTILVDVAYEMREYGQNLEADPERLEEVESRLSRLRQLQKKYGTSASEILEALASTEAEIQLMEESDERLIGLEAEARALDDRLAKLADLLHARRKEAAKLFAKEVNIELLDLNMKGVEFVIALDRYPEFTTSGATDAEFRTQTSKADAARPLAKAASGGELSRILLSIKQVVGGQSVHSASSPRTYLFDEVDTGVSGETAEKVGRKLRSIARGQQVICVTHLPQVAAHGDAHFFIQKRTAKDSAAMDVLELTAEKRVNEIARLISGEKVSATSLAHAKQLLKETLPDASDSSREKVGSKLGAESATQTTQRSSKSGTSKVRRESGLAR
jgi:DNA repair protein RecN (Recombination protein N)